MKVKSGIYMSPSRVSKTVLTCVCARGGGGGGGGAGGGVGIWTKLLKTA